ncbi:MAG TPA: VCBS repeat-containing protein [Solirubrobacteraceae bacterium]|jgi:hypothetical protein
MTTHSSTSRALLPLSLLLAAAAPAHAAPGRFGPGTDLPVATPEGLAVGDFDDDGRADLAVATGVAGKIVIFRQTTDGELVEFATFSTGGHPTAVRVADLDRDGHQDLAILEPGDHRVVIRLNNGDGTFREKPDVGTGSQVAASLAIGDMNGDGTDDLVLGTTAGANPSLVATMVNKGAGTFSVAEPVQANARGLVVTDVDGNAIADAVYGDEDADRAGILLGRGDARLRPHAPFSVPGRAARARSWATADLDANGYPDLVGVTETGRLAVRLGDPGAAYTGTSRDVPLGGGTPTSVAVGDLDGDGDEDVAAADAAGGGLVRVLLGDGRGGLTPAPVVLVGDSPVDLVLADFDGDGIADIATAGVDAGTVSIRPGLRDAATSPNLLVNGGFEGPVPGEIRGLMSIDGWTLTPGTGYLRYGSPSLSYSPSWLEAARFGSGGGRMLWGGDSRGSNGLTSATQTVDVSASAEAIDAGRVKATLFARLGGALAFDDVMSSFADFVDASGTGVGSIVLPGVTPADRRNRTTMLPRQGTRAVPAGTRKIRVTLVSSDADATYSSAIADDARLTLETAPEPAPSPSPEPAPAPAPQPGGGPEPAPGSPSRPGPVAAFGPRTGVTLSVRRRGSRRRVVVAIRNANAFAVRGRIAATAIAGTRRVALRRRTLTLAAGRRTSLGLDLPARARSARRVLVRATFTDPTGGRRVVKARRRLRG